MKSDIKIEDNRLEMTRYFEAPRKRVFDAWKQTELIQQWWGCAQTQKVETTMDFQAGGTFEHIMHLEGIGEHPYRGTFDEIVEPELIAYHVDINGTRADIRVEFFEEGEKTKLVLVQTGFPEMPEMDLREIISVGFTAALEKLDRLVSATPV